jgi:hypothetical protein
MKKIDKQALISAILSFVICGLTISGHVQQVIPFADPLNEIVFVGMLFVFGVFNLMFIKK